MSDVADPLPQDVAELQALVRYQGVLIEKIKHQLAGLRRHRFGSSSEALDKLELSLEGAEIAAAAVPATDQWQPRRQRRISRSAGRCPTIFRAVSRCCRQARPVGAAAAS